MPSQVQEEKNNWKPTLLSIHHLTYLHRSKASHGLWLIILLPLTYCLGFSLSAVYSYCQESQVFCLLSIQTAVSSLILLQDICGKDERVNFKRLKNFGKPIGISHFLPPIMNIFLIIYVTDIHPGIGIFTVSICLFIQLKLINWLFINFGKSFTIGECLLAGQAAALILTASLKGLIKIPSSLAPEEQQITSFVQIAVITCSICSIIIWQNRTRMTWTSLIGLFIVLGCFGLCASSVTLAVGCLPWLFHIINSSAIRIGLINWWITISVLIFVTSFISRKISSITQTVLRKMFHALLVLIFVPGIILDPSFTFVASSAAALFFLLLEIIRVCQISPFSQLLNESFVTFLDEKDEGPLILSHIYLLVGLSCPLWLYPCSFSAHKATELSSAQSPILPLLSGIISVGIGDTAASVGGTYFGIHKWRGTNKTIEGTLCSILFQLGFIAILAGYGFLGTNFGFMMWPRILVSVVITSIVEAFTDQVDNIVLPLLLYTFLINL